MTNAPTDLKSVPPFYTEETLVEEDKALLIGNGLKLRLLDENASPYTFNKYAEYADFTSDMLVYEKTYTAELSSIAGTPHRGWALRYSGAFLKLTITDLP